MLLRDLLSLRPAALAGVVEVMAVVDLDFLLLGWGRGGSLVSTSPASTAATTTAATATPATTALVATLSLSFPLERGRSVDSGGRVTTLQGSNLLFVFLSLPLEVGHLGLPGLGYLSQGVLHPLVRDELT